MFKFNRTTTVNQYIMEQTIYFVNKTKFEGSILSCRTQILAEF